MNLDTGTGDFGLVIYGQSPKPDSIEAYFVLEIILVGRERSGVEVLH